MKIEKIIINWEGPINLEDIKIIDENKDVGTGVYLWTSQIKENTYCVNYVGSSPVNGIFYRNKEHIKKFKQYSLIDYEVFNNEIEYDKKEINLKLCNLFKMDELEQDKLINLNLENSYIFYFPINEDYKKLNFDINNKYNEAESLNNFIRDVEGCLKLYFWKNGKTRRYLTFLESMRYNIDPKLLTMELKDKNVTIIGIND